MNEDILRYQPVINRTLAKLRVNKEQKEDLTQECYLALIEKQAHLSRAANEMAYASLICRNRIIDLWRAENQIQPGHEDDPKLRFDSLSDPKIYSMAVKIRQTQNMIVSDEQLEEAINSLPIDEYRVIHSLYVEGSTIAGTGENLGVSPWNVRTLAARAIQKLKTYFEVK